MNRYLEALDIVAFNAKTNKSDLNNFVDYPLLIAAVYPDNLQLEQLFYKITDSVKLINPQIKYEVLLLKDQVKETLLDFISKHRCCNLILLGEVIDGQILQENTKLTSDNLLITPSLAKLDQDVALKKQLWLDFKSFLANIT